MSIQESIDRLTIEKLFVSNSYLKKLKENNSNSDISFDYTGISNICVKNEEIVSLVYNNTMFSIGDKAHYIVSGRQHHFYITSFRITKNANNFEIMIGGDTLNDDIIVGHSDNQCWIIGLQKSEVKYKEYSII